MLVWRDIIRLCGRSPRQIYRGIALRLVAQLCSAVPFFICWFILQHTLVADMTMETTHWLLCALALLLCLAGQLLCSHFGQLDCFLGAYSLMSGYRAAVASHVRKLPASFFQHRRTGELSSVLTDSMKRLEDIFSHLLPEVIVGLSVPVILTAILLWVHWPLTIALLITVPPGLILMTLMSRHLLVRTEQQSDRLASLSGLLVEFVTGMRTLRLFNRQEVMLGRLDKNFSDIRSASMGIEAFGGGGVQLFRLLTELGLVVLFISAASLFEEDALNPATWLLFILVASKIIDPLLESAAWFTLMRVMWQSAERITRITAEPSLPETTSASAPADNSLSFDDVSFRYAPECEWVLKAISFHVPEGSVTALVGPSGSGKSTLLHLVGRFFSPVQGSIRLGDSEISALGSDMLYAHIGYVFQDVQLFDGSVFDNVRIGRIDASDEAVIAACREACCDDFIRQLPDGYHTRLGEGGQRLSGGERQRLSIARMLLKSPPVILLDEATALLDACVQTDVQRALSRLAQGRTVLIIAHRLKTVEYADQILVLDKGTIIARGTHRNLMAENELYARLWREQAAQSTLIAGQLV